MVVGATLVANMKAVVLLALVGCGDVVTPDKPSSPFENAEVDAPATAGEATSVALAVYAHDTGLEMPPVHVRWWGGDWIPDGSGGLLTGVTFACDKIWVWTAPDLKVGGTALAHELGHCAKWAADGNADPAHADPAWWGVDGYVMQALGAVQRAQL